jgi:endogenous inhibitor of DNA gyrase (YacG/DUF329 family)
MAKTLPCPTCRKPVQYDSYDMPFCSERCKLIDLGKWCSGEYNISTPIYDPEVLDQVALARERAGMLLDDDSHLASHWKN